MIRCAFCDSECNPTREHVIPRWYPEVVGRDGLETFNARKPTTHLRGDMLIKDVCQNCNNGPLGKLDGFGKALYQEVLSTPVYYGESIDFAPDVDRLLRWLLKLCFNSARVHGADIDILAGYRTFILGQRECPGPIALFVHLITPTDFSTDPPSPGYRIIGGDEDIAAPRWFRLTQFRLDVDAFADFVQRQVYIDGFCFTLFVGASNHASHSEAISSMEAAFLSAYPLARKLHPGSAVRISAQGIHAGATMFQHVANYPTRYGETPPSASAEFSEVMSKLAHGEYSALGITFTRDEVASQNIANIAGRLNELVATREAALSSMQRVALFTEEYDDDERELWQIPEVRRFLRALFEACPFVTFLLDPESKGLKLFAACCCPFKEFEGQIMEFEPDALREFIWSGFRGLNAVTQRHAISVEINRRISNEIVGLFHPIEELRSQLGENHELSAD